MVKFAEAEKRGRSGDGGDRRYAPVMMLERLKINRGMWESVKSHIMKERRKKKEELEADEEQKRMRKERENCKKQHAMTLDETCEQLIKEESKLTDLKVQKHELVQQLKIVLNEEKRRKDQEQQQQQQQQLHQQQQNYIKERESEMVSVHPYTHGSLSLGAHPQMIFPTSLVPGRAPNMPPTNMYKVRNNNLDRSIGTIKRSRSPSPPPPSQPAYQQIPFVFKNLAGNQNSVAPVTLSTAKSSGGNNMYLSNQPYYPSQASHTAVSQYPPASQAAVVAPYLATAAGPPTHVNPPPPLVQSSREEKHLQSLYLSPRGARPQLVLLPGQHPPVSAKGGITSGFPVRVSQAAPPPHSASSTVAHSYGGHTINRNQNYY